MAGVCRQGFDCLPAQGKRGGQLESMRVGSLIDGRILVLAGITFATPTAVVIPVAVNRRAVSVAVADALGAAVCRHVDDVLPGNNAAVEVVGYAAEMDIAA